MLILVMLRPRIALPFTTHLLLLLAVAILLPLALMLERIRDDAQGAEQRAASRAGWVVRRAAQSVASGFDVAVGTADTIANLGEFWNASDRDRDQLLSTLSWSYTSLDGLVYFGADAEPHGSSTERSDGVLPSTDWQGAVAQAATLGRPVVANRLEPSTGGGESALPIVVPITEAAAPYRQGFLGIELHLDNLAAPSGGAPAPDDASVILVDSHGVYNLLTSRQSSSGLLTSTQREIQEIVTRPRVFTTLDAAGHDQVAAWEAVAGTPWIVLARIPAESLLSPIRAQAAKQALGALGVTALLSMLLFAFWRRLRARLHALERAAGHWANSNWGHRATVAGADELSPVATAFTSGRRS
jgi:HAMP domain-containing protein